MTVGKHATEEKRRIAEAGMILRCQVGSGVHGTSISGTDDRDEMGICLEPPDYVIGLRTFEQYEYHTAWSGPAACRNRSGHGDLDDTIYSARQVDAPRPERQPVRPAAAFRSRVRDRGRDAAWPRTPRAWPRQSSPARPGTASPDTWRRSAGELCARGQGPRLHAPGADREVRIDTKFGGHMVRLGFQGVELLETGRITLPMPPRERALVRSIRKGR